MLGKGIGMPSYPPSTGFVLNLASRNIPHIAKIIAITVGNNELSMFIKNIAGATPKEIASERESKSCPSEVVFFVSLAIFPSRKSQAIAARIM